MQASEIKALRALVEEWGADSVRGLEKAREAAENGHYSTAIRVSSASAAVARCASRLVEFLDTMDAPEAEGDKP